MKTTAATALTIERQDVLVAVEPLQRLRGEGAEQTHEQDALGGAEVAAVDPRDEDADAQRPAVPARLRPRPAAARRPRALEPRTDETRTRAMRDEDRHDRLERRRRQHEQQRQAPTTEPTNDSGTSRRGSAVPCELARGSPSAGHAPGDEADVVGDVRDGGYAEEEQRREGDERARADDGVDGARREPGQR